MLSPAAKQHHMLLSYASNEKDESSQEVADFSSTTPDRIGTAWTEICAIYFKSCGSVFLWIYFLLVSGVTSGIRHFFQQGNL